jgi:RNA-dependent RNA polymerase
MMQRDNKRYGDMKDQILISVKDLQLEAKEWFESDCQPHEHQLMASAWYHVTYNHKYYHKNSTFLGFPWIVGDILLYNKYANTSTVLQKKKKDITVK